MSDRRQWKGPDFTVQVFKLTDSDTRVRSRTSPTTNVLAFLRLGQGETDSGDALFSRQETQVLGSHPSGNETESLGLGKGSRSEPGAELRLKIQLAVTQSRTAPRASKQPGHNRTTDTRCQNAILQGTRPVRTPGISRRRRPAQTETLAGTDHGSCLPSTRIVPTFLFRPPSARQRRREKSGTGPSNPRPREEPFLDPPGPRPAFGRPGSPERDCGPGCQSWNRPELSTPRTRCSALHARLGSSWESRAQAQARRTRMSHFSRIQPPAGLGWKTHMSRPVKW
jgi:hypothetical protein